MSNEEFTLGIWKVFIIYFYLFIFPLHVVHMIVMHMYEDKHTK